MTVISVALPDSLESFAAVQATTEGHGSVGNYLLALLRQAQQAKAKADQDAKLLAAARSLERGEGRAMTAEDWERLRSQVRQRHGEPEGP